MNQPRIACTILVAISAAFAAAPSGEFSRIESFPGRFVTSVSLDSGISLLASGSGDWLTLAATPCQNTCVAIGGNTLFAGTWGCGLHRGDLRYLVRAARSLTVKKPGGGNSPDGIGSPAVRHEIQEGLFPERSADPPPLSPAPQRLAPPVSIQPTVYSASYYEPRRKQPARVCMFDIHGVMLHSSIEPFSMAACPALKRRFAPDYRGVCIVHVCAGTVTRTITVMALD